MQGRRPIVLMLRNHDFYEHASAEGALVEAKRLTRMHGAETVVYVPVVAAHPPGEVYVEPITTQSEPVFEMAVTAGDETPFRALPDGGPQTRISRADAYRIVTGAVRAWPGETCPVDLLREECLARLGCVSFTFAPSQFGRVLGDMHRAGILTVSDGFASLVEQP
jgi:hypothetical protein